MCLPGNTLKLLTHCPKNNLNLCIKTESIEVGGDATVKVRFLGQILIYCRICKKKSDVLTHQCPRKIKISVFHRLKLSPEYSTVH